MSEYQFVHFLALDRPLDDKQQKPAPQPPHRRLAETWFARLMTRSRTGLFLDNSVLIFR
jgi:hypothetical protein